MIQINSYIKIPFKELEFTYSRSSGPGGQNVNKSNTKVTLRWNLVESSSVSMAFKERFLAKNSNKLTKNGEIILTSQKFRDQGRNTAVCIENLRSLLLEVAHPPKKRKKTIVSISAKKKRVDEKKRIGEKKRERKKIDW